MGGWDNVPESSLLDLGDCSIPKRSAREYLQDRETLVSAVNLYRGFKNWGEPWGGIGWANWPAWFYTLVTEFEAADAAGT